MSGSKIASPSEAAHAHGPVTHTHTSVTVLPCVVVIKHVFYECYPVALVVLCGGRAGSIFHPEPQKQTS